jgi:NADH dehydrogenase/NADH:ubiquinone oxidoreductase subunit G
MIPRFCYNNNLSVAGNCRICMVELKNSAKPVTSCTTNIMDKMVIFTDSPLVRKARENIMEFLLLNHPLDCPICDQGGECDLQDLSLNFGSDRSRFFNFKRVVEDKYCGPIIKTIMTRCIHCTKCVRFLQEVCNYPLYGTVGRGTHTEISTFLEKNLNNELSGNLIDLCPVGALTSKVETFLYRP